MAQIALRKSKQSAFIESFNARICEELLNETLVSPPNEACILLEQWRRDCNTQRPNSRVGWLTQSKFADHRRQSKQRPSGASQPQGFAPMAIASNAQQGNHGTESLPATRSKKGLTPLGERFVMILNKGRAEQSVKPTRRIAVVDTLHIFNLKLPLGELALISCRVSSNADTQKPKTL
jgi:hypothetical protein